jgi:hypothetical protein
MPICGVVFLSQKSECVMSAEGDETEVPLSRSYIAGVFDLGPGDERRRSLAGVSTSGYIGR